jgi:hypothetical protein
MRSNRSLSPALLAVVFTVACTDIETRCRQGFRFNADNTACVPIAADAGADVMDAAAPDGATDSGVEGGADVRDVPVDTCLSTDPPGDGIDQDCDGIDGTRGHVLFVSARRATSRAPILPIRHARSRAP